MVKGWLSENEKMFGGECHFSEADGDGTYIPFATLPTKN